MKKLRKLFGVILIICSLVVMQLPASEAVAQASSSDFSISEEHILTKYVGKSANVVIPEGVQIISTDAFKNNTNISNVVFPKSLKKIEAYAFWGSSLQSVTIGSGLEEIGDFAFANCKSLKSIDVPENIKTIGIYAFEDDVNLTDANITYKTMSIHDTAFDGCYKLVIHAPEGSYPYKYAKNFYNRQKDFAEHEDVTHGDGVPGSNDTNVDRGDGVSDSNDTNVDRGDEVPGSTTADTGSSVHFIYNPDGTVSSATDYSSIYNNVGELGSVHVVGNQAFIFMDSASPNVYMGSNPPKYDNENTSGADGNSAGSSTNTGNSAGSSTNIGNSTGNTAGGNTPAYPTEIYGSVLPKYTIIDGTVIADQAYYCNSSLNTVQIPETIREIGQFAYARSSASSVILPDGLERIDYGAFYHCDNLTTVTIPDSVKVVEPRAFSYTPWVDNFLAGKTNNNSDFLISGGVLVAYKGNSPQVFIPEGVRVIAAGAFAEHNEITEIDAPNTLEHIGEEAFYKCENLAQINLEKTAVTDILDRAFSGTKVMAVTLPDTIESVGINAFEDFAKISYRGNTIPRTTHEATAERLSNSELRKQAYKSYTHTNSTAIKAEPGVRVNGLNGVQAYLEGAQEAYILSVAKLANSPEIQNAKDRAQAIIAKRSFINGSYYDLELSDESGISITKLGKVGLTVALPIPEALNTSQKLTVLTVDRNGQLEELIPEIVSVNGAKYVRFTTYHLSPFAIYGTGEIAVEDDIIIAEEAIAALAAPPTYDENISFGKRLSNWAYAKRFRLIPAAALFIGGFVLILSKRKRNTEND